MDGRGRMAGIVVERISENLKILGQSERFIFGLSEMPEPLGAFKLDNIFTPTAGVPSVTNFETRNKDLSGFRWVHTTNAGDTFGSYKLQSFINAQNTGTDILLFNQDGTVTFNQPVSFPGFAITGDLDMNSHKIINLADPVNAQDAATKSFVETLVGSGTITLSGAVSGTGQVGNDITTTLNTVAIDKLAGYPTDSSLFLRGDGEWSNNFAKIGVNFDPTEDGVIQFANGTKDAKIILNKDAPSNPWDISAIGYLSTWGTLYHTPIGKSHLFFTGANGNLGLEISPLTLKVGYGITSVDFRKLVFYEGIVDSNPNQTYAIGVELDGTPNNHRNVRTQVQTINDAFRWCYGIDANTSGEWMRLNNSGLNLYNKRIFNVADPVDDQDLVTKLFLQTYVQDAIDANFGPAVSLPFEELSFNWSYASTTNPTPYQFTNTLTDSQISKNFKYRVSTTDVLAREWNHNYTLIGNSDVNGIYQLNYVASGSTITPINIAVYPFAASQNRMTMGVPINMGGFEITNALNPTTAQSLATRSYVDSAVAGSGGSVTLTGAVTGSGTGTVATTLTPTVNINSASYAFNLNNANSAGITEFQISYGIPYLKFGVNTAGAGNYIDSIFDNFIIKMGGTDRFIFSSVGNLGIGGSGPTQAKLVVNGGVQNVTGEETAIRAISSLNNVKIELQSTAAGGKLYELRSSSTGGFDITDRTGSAARFTITTLGNIGIGTNTPNAPLQLANVITNRQIVLYEAANNNFQFHGFGSIAGGLGYNINTTTDSHVFFAGASATTRNEVARISGTGTAQFRKIAGYANTKPNIGRAGSLGVGATFTINGSSSELSGTITIFSGTSGNASGPLVGISLLNVMPNSNWGVILFPGNSSATQVTDRIFAVVANNFQFTINTRTALANNTTYIWNYHIIGA